MKPNYMPPTHLQSYSPHSISNNGHGSNPLPLFVSPQQLHLSHKTIPVLSNEGFGRRAPISASRHELHPSHTTTSSQGPSDSALPCHVPDANTGNAEPVLLAKSPVPRRISNTPAYRHRSSLGTDSSAPVITTAERMRIIASNQTALMFAGGRQQPSWLTSASLAVPALPSGNRSQVAQTKDVQLSTKRKRSQVSGKPLPSSYSSSSSSYSSPDTSIISSSLSEPNGTGPKRSPLGPKPSRKRQKMSTHACNRCRRTKKACSGGDVCTQCEKGNYTCTYSGQDRRTNADSLAQLNQLLDHYGQQLPPARLHLLASAQSVADEAKGALSNGGQPGLKTQTKLRKAKKDLEETAERCLRELDQAATPAQKADLTSRHGGDSSVPVTSMAEGVCLNSDINEDFDEEQLIRLMQMDGDDSGKVDNVRPSPQELFPDTLAEMTASDQYIVAGTVSCPTPNFGALSSLAPAAEAVIATESMDEDLEAEFGPVLLAALEEEEYNDDSAPIELLQTQETLAEIPEETSVKIDIDWDELSKPIANTDGLCLDLYSDADLYVLFNPDIYDTDFYSQLCAEGDT